MWIDGFRAVRQKPHFGFRAESQAARSPAVYLTSEALSFRRAPCRMWTTHTLLTVIDFIDDPVNVRLLAVTQVPQFASRPSGFRGCRTAMRKGRKHENRFLQTVTPARGRLGLGGVLFQEKGFKIVGRAIGKLNVICLACNGYRQKLPWGDGCGHGPCHQVPGGFLLPNPR
jgi:hypothetical protein